MRFEGVYKCGHEGCINIVGPSKDRQWKADYQFSGLCPKCAEAERIKKIEAENKEAQKRASEWELPLLEGSEKQIAWANTLRIKALEDMESTIEDMGHGNAAKHFLRSALDIVTIDGFKEYFLKLGSTATLDKIQDTMINEVSASWWINNRHGVEYAHIIAAMVEAFKKHQECSELKPDVVEETSLSPEDVKFPGIVDIYIQNCVLYVKYIKDDTFRQIVKEFGCKWEGGSWQRKITEYNGPSIDRMAEIGNRLLRAGFRISIQDAEAREKAVNGKYTPERDKWIKRVKGKDEFSITWKGKDDEIYCNARKIPGARWKGSVLVPIASYKELEDFADVYKFQFSKAALLLIQEYRARLDAMRKVSPEMPGRLEEKNRLHDLLNSSGTIIDDLRDV